MQPPVLLFIVHDAPFFVSHRLAVGRSAVLAGYRVHVAAPEEAGAAATIRSAGLVFHPIALDRGSRHPLKELVLIGAMAGVLRRLEPDIVHCVGMKPVLYGGSLARLLKVPGLVNAVTGLGFMFLRTGLAARAARTAIRQVYRYALGHPNSRTIFQNPDDLALFEAAKLVPPDRVVTIKGCGVDLAAFRPTDRRPDGPPVVMFPARLIRDKGLGEFLAAVRLLRPAFPDVRFVLVGRTDAVNPTAFTEAEVESWVRDGLVEWWGFSDDMPATLRRADIIVLPSYREGLPRGLIEAAATGLPIVATDVPGCREIVHHGENGLLVPARDPAATAAAIRDLLEAPARAETYGKAGRAMVEREYSVERFVGRSLHVYREVLV